MQAGKRAGVHRKGAVALSDLINQVRGNPNFRKAGAIGIFIGVVRGETPEGRVVKKLELEAYEEKASEALEKICAELREKEGIVDVQIHHLIGEFNVGEDLVYVIVAGSHRHQVFPVLEEAVERYKRETFLFKKEYVSNEKGEITSYWVSEREK